jgi:hypothetical protein
MPPVTGHVADVKTRDAGNGDVRDDNVSVLGTVARSVENGRHV